MGRETILFKSEEKKTAAEVAAMLRVIADKVEAGGITLKSADSEVVLDIPGQVTLEIKAEEEEGQKTKRSLEVEIEWVLGESADTGVSIG